MIILNKLLEEAAAWAGPFIVKVATDSAILWADCTAFTMDFKAHFCAANNNQATIRELTKLCKALHKLSMVKDYTTEFNTIAAHMAFSNTDKHK